jgi:hypothetical protein
MQETLIMVGFRILRAHVRMAVYSSMGAQPGRYVVAAPSPRMLPM